MMTNGKYSRPIPFFRSIVLTIIVLGVSGNAFAYDRDPFQGLTFFQQQNLENRQYNWSDKRLAVDVVSDYAESGNLKLISIFVDGYVKDNVTFGAFFTGVDSYKNAKTYDKGSGDMGIYANFKRFLNLPLLLSSSVSFQMHFNDDENIVNGIYLNSSWDATGKILQKNYLVGYFDAKLNLDTFRLDTFFTGDVTGKGSYLGSVVPSLHLLQNLIGVYTKVYSERKDRADLDLKLQLGNSDDPESGIRLYAETGAVPDLPLGIDLLTRSAPEKWRYYAGGGMKVKSSNWWTGNLRLRLSGDAWYQAEHGLGYGGTISTNALGIIISAFARYNDYYNVRIIGGKPDWSFGIGGSILAGF